MRAGSGANVDRDGAGFAPEVSGEGEVLSATPANLSRAPPTTFGKYQLFASLGRGGMADVFLAVARGPMGFNKLAVVKRLRSSLSDEASFLNMFLDEARLAARLNHPNVVHAYEVGEHDGAYFIAMEYLEGQSLNRVMREATKRGIEIPAPVAARIVSDALLGLHHAHELRDYDGRPLEIIHRDISPHNVFVTYEGVTKLVDFGIAKASLSSTQTEVGVLKGKVAYMSPEQAMGQAMDRRADTFAMGIVLWELLTRKRLMSGDSAASTLHRLLNMPVPRASAALPSIDPKLDAIVAKSLEKDPARRFASALEMREALEGWMTAAGHVVRQEEVGQRVTAMFTEVRDQVRRQVQAYMSATRISNPPPELAMGSLRNLNTDSLVYDPATGTGSGIVPLNEGGQAFAPDQFAELVLEHRGRRNKLVMVLVLLLAVFSVVAFLIIRYAGMQHPFLPAPTARATAPAVTEPPPTNATTPAPTAETPLTVTAEEPQPTSTAPLPAPPPTSPKDVTKHTPPSPTVPKPQNTAAAAQEETGPGYLSFDSFPWTRVYDGGRLLGTTPLFHVALSPGVHVLTLENPDQGIKTTFGVTIKSGESVSKRIGLK